jgi:hypothetical protein
VYALWCAQNKAPLGEVVKMNEHLSKFYNDDKGFEQFVDRFNKVSSDKKTLEEYTEWLFNMRLEAENLAKLVAEGKAEGEAIGIAKRDREIALAALEQSKKADFSDEIENLKELNIPENIIEMAIKHVKAKHDE